MEIEKPRRTSSTTPTSELFICFTSRLSNSSSMRLTSKSILSPSRAADKSAASLSLSTSLSRRLRHNGSLRGAQSPAMFPPKKIKGGPGFDNPEPSSPKVTCIGQVRVKTKKQGKKMKMRACRLKRLSGDEASFRRIKHAHEGLIHQNSQGIQNQTADRNQRWVHLPLTICEALRAFGAEFSCLLPCKSSCFSSCGGGGGGEIEKRKEREGEDSRRSCGAVFRWLVAMQEGEGEEEEEGRQRDIEMVVGEREGRERMVMGIECSSRRRSVFDDIEFNDEIFDGVNDVQEDEAARVSICVPPKNALMLMRCRSDPAKMSALSDKIWEAPVADDSDQEEDEQDQEEKVSMAEKTELVDEMCGDSVVVDANVEVHLMVSPDSPISSHEKQSEEETEEKQSAESRDKEEQIDGGEENYQSMEDEIQSNRCSIDAITIRKMFEEGPKEQDVMKNIKEEERERGEINDFSSSSSSSSSYSAEESTVESSRETQQEKEKNDKESVKSIEKEVKEEEEEEDEEIPLEQVLEQGQEREITKQVLPDSLLLMKCEPKLSMEVSKETWVCSTDFIRWLPERHQSKKTTTKTDGSDETKKKKRIPQIPFPQPAVQPGRSSISFPPGRAEQKVGKPGVGSYEPCVLTRCKSAPMRSMAKNAAATELACRNGPKMEPHRPAAYGVGAAGVGF